MKLIIDTDPGIDDAMAIFYAHAAPEIDLIALTAVFGNVTQDMATRNALRLAEEMDTNIPVARGAEGPWKVPFTPSTWVHGAEGFGDIPAATPKGKDVAEDAADYLARIVREAPGEITIAPIGPLTNIANAIERHPDFVDNVGHLAIMGGAVFVGGNITDAAEANIYHDPHAAKVVLQSGAPMTLIGLDVTLKTLATTPDFEKIAQASPHLGGMLLEMSHFYIDFYRREAGLDGCGLHDPVAIMSMIRPEFFKSEDIALDVITEGPEIGRTIPIKDGPKVKVLTEVDAPAVLANFIEVLSKNP